MTYTNDALTLTTTNKVSNATADRADVILGAKKSETVYSGNEGEEKAQNDLQLQLRRRRHQDRHHDDLHQ